MSVSMDVNVKGVITGFGRRAPNQRPQTQTQIQNPSPGIRQTGTGEVVTVSVTVTAMNLLPVSILSLPLEDDNDSSTKPVNTITCHHGFSRLKTTLTYARCLSKKNLPTHLSGVRRL